MKHNAVGMVERGRPLRSAARAGWICAAIGLTTHLGLLAYARNAPSPVYEIAADEGTVVDIEAEVDDVSTRTTTAEIPKRDEDPTTASADDGGQGAAVANGRPKGAVGPRLGPSPVIASDEPGGSDTNTAPNAIRRRWDPSMDAGAYGDPNSPDGYTFDPANPQVAGHPLGFDPDSIGPGKKADTTTRPPEKIAVGKANDVLQDALHEKDAKLGMILPAAGTVASTVKAAVSGSSVPDEAQGTVVVTLGADGSVTGVKVTSMAGGTAGDWEGIAANVKAALSAKTLVLTDEYKKGAVVTIVVKSKRQNPSGTDPDSPVKIGPESTFDLSDIGAKPIRQVTTHTAVTPIK